MDYINYVKQSPMSMSGLGGSVGGLNFKSGSSPTWYGARGWWTGGSPGGPPIDTMQYITIASTGNATDAGNLGQAVKACQSCGGGGRILTAGGNKQTDNDKHFSNEIQAHVSATTSNSSDFGDLTVARSYLSAVSDGTRGLWATGRDSSEDDSQTMDYVTIASNGNATNFGYFGWASGYHGNARTIGTAGCTGATRGAWAGGKQPGLPFIGSFYYVTIQTTSNTTTGIQELTTKARYLASLSNDARGVWAGGDVQGSPGYTNRIEYMTIANMSATSDFGDLTATAQFHSGLSDGTAQRGVFAPITTGNSNEMDYITIDSTGNATDFGDLISNISRCAGASNT